MKSKLNQIPDQILNKILSYLKTQEIDYKFGGLSIMFNKQIKEKTFWYKLYLSRYKNPGFKFEKVNWKNAYQNKEKK